MKRIFLGILLLLALSFEALGQVSAPALINQRGTTTPSICTIGQLFFDTDATAGANIYGCTAANTWTLMDGGPATSIAIGISVTGGGANRVLYEGATQLLAAAAAFTYNGTTVTVPQLTNSGLTSGRVPYSSTAGLQVDAANLTYDNSTIRLTIGTGSTTAVGLVGGYTGTSTYGGLWGNAVVTPAIGNVSLLIRADGLETAMNMGTTAGSLQWTVANSPKISQAGTAGAGPAITAGTAIAASVYATRVQRTNNNALVDKGFSIEYTDTTSAAGFLPLQVLGGAGGVTNLLSVGKAGALVAVSLQASTGTVTAGSYFTTPINYYNEANGTLGYVLGATSDTNMSRVSAGVVGIGTGAAGSVAGTLSTTGLIAAGSAVTLSGLGSSTGTPNSLCLNGTTVTVNAALTCTVSARAFKTGIEPFTSSGLELVAQIDPYKFYYPDNLKRQRLGLMADDLGLVDRRLAEWNTDGTPSSIDMSALHAVEIKAIQELETRVKKLEAANDDQYKLRVGL